ncbi:hypothetical protein ACFY1A_48035 [Streptomyces sp. NPDC001520]|uniref:hypothetical protein n=1 Tax=Streptomyces sp. NPDC001520 TaxID=3364581 RepID=UPI0036BA73DA
MDSHAHLTSMTGAHPSGRSPAHERLAQADVTTAVEFYDFRTVLDQWHASAAGPTILGLQGIPTYPHGTPAAHFRDDVDAALRDGAVGIRLFGGHYPKEEFPDDAEHPAQESMACPLVVCRHCLGAGADAIASTSTAAIAPD